MQLELGGLHHVTAITGKARENLDFYTRVLGLRLVKKTVNQDVTSSYHLFYADEVGTPGTDMTFFDWPNVPQNMAGNGEASATGFMVPEGSLDWWAGHLDNAGVNRQEVKERNGYPVLAFMDPEGQRLELIEGGTSAAIPWAQSEVPEEFGIRGLGAVTLTVASESATAVVLERLLNFRPIHTYAADVAGSGSVTVYECGTGGLGTEVRLEVRPDFPRAQSGVGGVHHVAFRVPDEEAQREWRSRIAEARMPVTEIIDRFYFKSIYFREPGGVLFEIATDGPGFAQDEDVSHLGEGLSLPPFLEPRRAEIESQLEPL